MAAAAAAAAAASVGAADDSGVLVDAPLDGESHLDDIVSLSFGPVKSAVDEDASVDLALRAFFFRCLLRSGDSRAAADQRRSFRRNIIVQLG